MNKDELKAELLSNYSLDWNPNKKKWSYNNNLYQDEKLILELASSIDVVPSVVRDALEEIKNNCSTNKDASYYIDIFLEDIQKPISERSIVPSIIPQIVVNKSCIEESYDKDMLGMKFSRGKFVEFFKATVSLKENRKFFR